MKKVLTILFVLASMIAFAQRPIQPLGTTANEVKVLGTLSVDDGLFVTPFASLAAADADATGAKTRGGSLIFITSTNELYYRNQAATAWIKIALATSAYTLLSQFVDEPAWQMYYSNAAGDVTPFALGAVNTVLLGGGINAPPTWGTIPNGALTNNSITVNGTTIALGASGTLVLASANFANQGTATTLLHGNAAGNPTWAAVNLANEVTGDLLMSNLQQFGANTIAANPTTSTADLSSVGLGLNNLIGRGSTGNIAPITIAGSLSFSGTVLTGTGITSEVDGSITNELQTYAHTGTTSYTNTLSQSGGSFTLQSSGIVTISHTAGTVTIGAAEVDGSVSNELQTLASISDATSHTVTLSNSGGSIKFIEGANITLTTTGTGLDGVITIASTVSGYTDEQAQDAVGLMINASLQYVDATPLLAIGDRNFGDITTTGSGLNMAINANAVTFAKFVQGAANTVVTNPTTGTANFTTTALAANNLLGRGSTGNIAPITIAGSLSFSGTVLTGTGITSEVDGSVTNELQTLASTSDATSHTVTLSNSGGSFKLVEGTGITLTTTGTGLDGVITIASTASGGGITTLAPIGSTPNANAATITGGTTLNLQPADVSFGGVVTTVAQAFAGNKIFKNGIESYQLAVNTNFRAGGGALVAATTAFENVAVGYNAGATLTTGADNVIIGYVAGASFNSNRVVAIGAYAGTNETTDFFTAVGYGALGGSFGAGNTAIGHESMNNATGAQSTAIGDRTMMNNAGTANVGVGNNVAESVWGSYNTLLGAFAAYSLQGGAYNVIIGGNTAREAAIGIANNVIIGSEAGYYSSGSGNIYIGRQAGYTEAGSNRLYIENSSTTTPLIYGEFDNDLVRVNGQLQVVTTQQNIATFTSNSGAAGGIKIDGNVGSTYTLYSINGADKFKTFTSDVINATIGTDGLSDFQIHNMQDNWTAMSFDGASNYAIIGANLWGVGNVHAPGRRLEVYERFNNDYSSLPTLRLTTGSANSGAIGNGTGIEIALSNASPYDFKNAAYLDARWTAVAGGLHSADFVVSLMQGGAAYAEKMRVRSTGELGVQLLNQDDAEAKVVVWNSTDKFFEWRAASTLTGTGGGGYTNLTQFLTQTPYRMFYSDLNGDVQELPHGTSGQILTSGGASANPSWTTVSSVGEANTASSLGGGVNVYSTKVGVDLRFNTLNASDFIAVGNVIGIAYSTAQAASGTLKGFLTSADWTTFNGKNAGILFDDEGVALGAAATVNEIDFVGAGVTATRASNKVTVTITGGGGGSGEINTASNLGGGIANYSTKSGVDLQFNSFNSNQFSLASNLISAKTQMSITSDANGLMLSGDATSPGGDKFYGTNFSGTRGFYSLPTVGAWSGLFASTSSFNSPTTITSHNAYVFIGASPVTLTMPSSPASYTNKAIFIKNAGSAALTVARSGSDQFFTNALVTSFDLQIGESAMIWSNGTYYLVHYQLAGGGSGEINTASNVGGGLANFNTKSVFDLQFNTFTASDFNLASNLIAIDYTNGQAASGSLKGFLASADWTTFNGKQAGIQYEDEGVAQGAAGTVNEIDFVGAGVTVSRTTNALTVTIAGGGASGITVGTTTITGGTSGRPLYNNAGVVGEMSTSGTGTVAILSNSPQFLDDITVGTTAVSSGSIFFTGLTSGSTQLTIPAVAGTGTLTLPTITGTLMQYAEASIVSNATWSPQGDTRENYYDVTLQAAAVTVINAPTGTPANHNTLLIRVRSDGTARAISGWNAIYKAGTNLAFPTTTTLSKTMYIKFIYSSTTSTWDLISVLDGL